MPSPVLFPGSSVVFGSCEGPSGPPPWRGLHPSRRGFSADRTSRRSERPRAERVTFPPRTGVIPPGCARGRSGGRCTVVSASARSPRGDVRDPPPAPRLRGQRCALRRTKTATGRRSGSSGGSPDRRRSPATGPPPPGSPPACTPGRRAGPGRQSTEELIEKAGRKIRSVNRVRSGFSRTAQRRRGVRPAAVLEGSADGRGRQDRVGVGEAA